MNSACSSIWSSVIPSSISSLKVSRQEGSTVSRDDPPVLGAEGDDTVGDSLGGKIDCTGCCGA